MNSSNNIINFPREKYDSPDNIQSQEDMLRQIVDYKTSFANDITEMLSNYIFGELARSGINFEKDIDILFPSMVLVTESIQSLQLKASELHHPLQDFAEDVFSEENDPDILVDKSNNMDYDISSDKKDEDN